MDHRHPETLQARHPHHQLHIIAVRHRDSHPLSVFADRYPSRAIAVHGDSRSAGLRDDWHTSILNAYFNVDAKAISVHCLDPDCADHV